MSLLTLHLRSTCIHFIFVHLYLHGIMVFWGIWNWLNNLIKIEWHQIAFFLCWCAIKKLLTHSIEHGHDRRAIVLIVIIAHFSNQYVFKYCICIFSTDCCYIVTCCYCICFKHLLYCVIRHVCYISKMHNFLWCSTFTPLLPSIQGASKNNPICKQWFLNNVVNILMHFFVIYSQWRRHSRCVGCEKNTEYFCSFFLVIYA